MDKIQIAKEIVAAFLHIEAADVGRVTVIDKTSLTSSLLLHRMYAALSAEGIMIAQPRAIRNFGDLAALIGEKNAVMTSKEPASGFSGNGGANGHGLQIDIDIEDVNNMPVTDDFRENSFYTMTFSSKEISYCILQSDPVRSFAGLFAAKEAIVKADNQFRNLPFFQLEISHDAQGGPRFRDFMISISHGEKQAIAVAVKTESARVEPMPEEVFKEMITKALVPVDARISRMKWLLYMTILFGLLACVIGFGLKLAY